MIYPKNLGEDNRLIAFYTDRNEGIDPVRISSLSGFPEKSILYMKQEHTDRIVVFDRSIQKNAIACDGMITNLKGILLSVKVADCVPILMWDSKREVIAAVHAGWRGTARGIIKNAIRLFADEYNSSIPDILISMGPAIRWCCYSVDDTVFALVKGQTGEGDYYIIKDDRICLDLPHANKYQAISEGVPVENIWMSEECTFCYPEKYFSYRYNKTTERQGGFIGLR